MVGRCVGVEGRRSLGVFKEDQEIVNEERGRCFAEFEGVCHILFQEGGDLCGCFGRSKVKVNYVKRTMAR